MSRFQASCVLLFAALLWGSGNVFQQTILQNMGPFMANGLRCLIAVLAVIPFCWRADRHGLPLDRNGKWLGLLSVLSFTAATATLQIAYGLTSVANAGFLANTSTVLTPFIAWLLLRELPTLVIIPASGLAFTGICLLGGGWPGSFSWGDSLCLLAAAFFALWMVLQGSFVTQYGRSASLTLVQFLGCGLICLMIAVLAEARPTLTSADALMQLVYLGVISTGGGYFLLAIGQRYASASETAIIISVEAVFGACFAHLLLGDQQTSVELMGAVLIVSAIVLIELPVKKIKVSLKRRSKRLQKINNTAEVSALPTVFGQF